MTMVAHKFRIYPTAAQRDLLAQWFGASRFAWNVALEMRSRAYKDHGEKLTGVDISRQLTQLKKDPNFDWLAACPFTVLTQKLRDQDTAFGNFFAGRARYPKFRSKHHAQTIRFQMDQRKVASNYRPGELLRLPKLGEVKVKWSRIPGGIPKMVTVRMDAAGRYFASFMVEQTVEQLPPRANAAGIDMGLKDVVVTSDGWKSGNPRHLRRLERRLKMAQRRLSRKTKGSNRRNIQRRKVAVLHARVADARTDWLHKLTTQLVRDHQFLAIEDLNIRAMHRTRLAKSVGDAGLGELRRQLTYKAAWYGRDLHVIDRWAPTSKACSACGSVQKIMPLQVRAWTCPDCGTDHDRDVNAAINVLNMATVGSTGGSTLPMRVERGLTPKAAA